MPKMLADGCLECGTLDSRKGEEWEELVEPLLLYEIGVGSCNMGQQQRGLAVETHFEN